MTEEFHNTEDIKDRKLETISAITVLSIFLTITAYILYWWENKYRDEYYEKERGFTSIIAAQFNGPSGEHQQLKQHAQKLLAFPQSYKHIETIYIHNQNHQELFIRSIFSGQNAYQVEEILCLKASYSPEGQILKNPTVC